MRLASRAPESWMPPITRMHMAAQHRFWQTVHEWRRFLLESERWSEGELQDYQLRQLRTLLSHAYEHVPYYRGLFEGLGILPEEIRELSDLRELPALGKRELQEHQQELLATNVPAADRVYFTSAGSTGIPVGFFHDRDTAAKDFAFMTTQWRRCGFRDGDRMAVVRGNVLAEGKLFERVPWRNTLVMSSYHLTEARLPLYVSRLRDFSPKFIQAYPSAATLLARHMLDHREPPIGGIQAVLCGSENLYGWQRRQIEEAFNCRVFSWYGQSERVCLAGECEHDSRLHIFPQYGVVELVDASGQPVEGPGAIGHIVATGFLTKSMPLIRYRTMDLGSLSEGRCKGCNRPYALFERIEGRLQEFIISGTGRYISMAAINMHSPVFDNVYEFRFRQSVPGKVTLFIVPKRGYRGLAEEEQIRRELSPKLGHDMELEIEAIAELPRGGRGKFGFLDQQLPGPFEP